MKLHRGGHRGPPRGHPRRQHHTVIDEQGRVLPRPGQRVGAPPADQQHAARVGGETRRDRAMWLHTVISCDQSAAMATRSSRSEEHTSELQSLMRISYAVFCLKKKKQNTPKRTKKYRIH